jgi:hypothetical protein
MACRVRQRPEGKGADGGLKAGWHGRRAELAGGQHRQQQPGGGLRISLGVDVSRILGAPDQVGEVSGDGPDGIPGRVGQIGLRGQSGRVREQHAVSGARVRVMRVRGPLPWSPVHGLGEYAGEQPGRGGGAVGQAVQ